MKRWQRFCFILLLIGLITACGANKPPKGLAPGREMIKNAIARKLTLTENRLTEKLHSPSPTDFDIQNVNIKQLNPLYIADLPTYQINGTYKLKLKLPKNNITQNNNQFEVYLQRQVEGKTWRLLIPESPPNQPSETEEQEKATAWRSYLVT